MPILFSAYAITGGLPKYLERLAENSALPSLRCNDQVLHHHGTATDLQ
jgi:hypothetical protein